MVVAGQLDMHEYPCKFKVLQEVQLVWVMEQVAQSPWHCWANPLILTYPLGVVSKHAPLKKIYPTLHF